MSEESKGQRILAVVICRENKEKIGGGAPIFYVQNKQEQKRVSMLLSRILMGMVHDLENGIKIIVQH